MAKSTIFENMRIYIRNLALLDLVLIAVMIPVSTLFEGLFSYNEIALMGVLLPVHTAFNHYQFKKTLMKNPKKFPSVFLMLTFIKLFTYLIFAIVVAFLLPLRTKGFIITEAVFYLAFLAYETLSLSKLVKTKK